MRMQELPDWLLADAFSSSAPFLLTGRGLTYHACVVNHTYREPGIYAVVVKSTVKLGHYCEVQ